MSESLGDWKRTHTCGELNSKVSGNQVTLMGWVDRRRDHGSLIFVDIRDRYGKTQLVFNPQHNDKTYEQAKALKSEFVIAVKGVVNTRPSDAINRNLTTGEIEVEISDLRILNEAEVTPFLITDPREGSEELRLKYRYLDLRHPDMQKNIILRHQLTQVVRKYFDQNNFIEIETPVLMRSTPEGARDFLVPSRLYNGKFFALPQSPQIYKQILMVSGFDRYYQIVRCFRDEDLRADRQPEFTQIDVEMSFVDEEDVFSVMEKLMVSIYRELMGQEIKTPFLRLSYQECIERFGVDKPDMRFGMEIQTVTDLLRETDFRVFNDSITANGVIAGINIPDGASYSRSQIDELNKLVQSYGAKGVLAQKILEGVLQGGCTKFLSTEQQNQLIQQLQASDNDLILLLADQPDITFKVLGALRLHFGEKLKLIDKTRNDLLWVVDFPLVEFDEDEQRYDVMHHPFTSPKEADIELMESDPGKVRARAYDLVLNGTEIAGGSIRIHRPELQQKMFRLLGIGPEEAQDKFGFLLEAFKYGAPPHGGIAFGFDRLAMILVNGNSIRDVIAFPKTASALSLMDGSPSHVDEKQLNELGLKIIENDSE